MVEKLGADTLRDGQSLETFLLDAPCEKWGESILGLAYEIDAVRVDALWQWQMAITVKGEADGGLETLFYLGVLSGEPIAMLMLFLNRSAGILAYVATAAAHRGKGACDILLRTMLADSWKRGCRVMTVNTRYKGPLYGLLEKHGFKNLRTNSDSLILEQSAGALQALFATSPVRAGTLSWEHFPLVDKLYCIPEGVHIRSVANRVFGPGTYEGGFVTDMKAVLEGGAQGSVLESTGGFVVGHACLRPDEIWARHHDAPNTRLLDFFVHPAFVQHLPDLLGTLDLRKGKTLCFVDADSLQALATLTRVGFRSEGRLKKQTAKGDVEVMGFLGSA